MIKKISFNFLRYIGLLIVVSCLSTALSWFTWNFYDGIFQEKGGTWIDLRSAVGFVLNYIFFTPLIFTLFGERYKYWVILFFFIPILFYELVGNFRYTIQDLLIALVGLGIGWLLRYGLRKMPAMEPWKKYF